jgi:hypothetical protein
MAGFGLCDSAASTAGVIVVVCSTLEQWLLLQSLVWLYVKQGPCCADSTNPAGAVVGMQLFVLQPAAAL